MLDQRLVKCHTVELKKSKARKIFYMKYSDYELRIDNNELGIRKMILDEN